MTIKKEVKVPKNHLSSKSIVSIILISILSLAVVIELIVIAALISKRKQKQ